MEEDSSAVDLLDQRIIRCIQLTPRVPFSLAASVLEVSEQTVARRYRRLVREGLLRVTAVIDPDALGQSNWMIRVRCRPSGAESLGRALAQRDDVSWVTLCSGGSEVICVLRARTSDARNELLIEKLPRSTPVLDIEAAMVLHRFVGGGLASNHDWIGRDDLLTPEQTAAVEDSNDLRRTGAVERITLTDEDLRLLETLTRDGRATYQVLGNACGQSEARAARRLHSLVAAGAAYLDVDVMSRTLGCSAEATILLTAEPGELNAIGTALAAERAVPFAAAITGRANLIASVVCTDVPDLYTFVTERVGALHGVRSVEVIPHLRHLKQAGSLVSGQRLTT